MLETTEYTTSDTEMTQEEIEYVLYLNERDARIRATRENFPDEYKAWQQAEVHKALKVLAEYAPYLEITQK